jgi:hypothetical protein
MQYFATQKLHFNNPFSLSIQAYWTKKYKPIPANQLVPFMTDTFGSTNVNTADFIAGILRVLEEADPEQAASSSKQRQLSTFERLDKDGSGDLTLSELQV